MEATLWQLVPISIDSKRDDEVDDEVDEEEDDEEVLVEETILRASATLSDSSILAVCMVVRFP